jgi:cell division transport system permease protein
VKRVRELRRAARSARKSIWRNFGGFLAAAASIAVALCMTGIALLLQQQVEITKGAWYDKAGITVYFCTADSTALSCAGEPGQDAKTAIQERVSALEGVEAVYYETREAAWEEFYRRYSNTEIAQSVTPEALPESLRVRAASGVDREDLLRRIGTPTGVEQIVDQRQSLRGFFRVVGGLQLAAGIFALVQASATTALVGNLVRTSLRQRRNEVRIMDLVGAPARVVRAPFVLESVTVCMLGAMAATGVLTLGVGKVLPGVASGSGLQLIGTQHALRLGVWMLLGSVLIGWLVSRVSLRLGSREED